MRGLVRVQNIENPRYIDIVFNSFKRSIQETLHRIKVANEGQNDDWVVGGYDLVDGSIHFNFFVDELNENELARAITHELIHMLQDEAEKYPAMRQGNQKFNEEGVDNNSPWEREAYRLQELLYRDFIKDCVII